MMLIVLEIDVLHIINAYILYRFSVTDGLPRFFKFRYFVIFCNKYASFSYIFILLVELFADISAFFGYPKIFLR